MTDWIASILSAFCIAMRYTGLVLLAVEIRLLMLFLN